VADGDMARKVQKRLLVKHLPNQPHAPVGPQIDAVGNGDARAFLAAVLQRVESVVRQLRRIRMAVNAKEPAVMTRSHVHSRI